MTKTLIMQPRHNYAPDHGEGHLYLPTSPLTFAARILAAGGDVDIADENIRPADTDRYDTIGANLVGLPYVPVVRDRFRHALDYGQQNIMLGGVVVAGLTRTMKKIHSNKREQILQVHDTGAFHTFFGDRAIPCTDVANIARATNVPQELLTLKPDEQVSLIPAYAKIIDGDMQQHYLNREISFYLAQGCNQGCVFCAAPNEQQERYRGADIIKQDLAYLTTRAQRLGLQKLTMYLSNLDVFQNPEQLEVFFDIVLELQRAHPGFVYRMRGLAITSSLVRTHRKFRHVLDKAVHAGFHTVGMGVDGGSDEIRRNLKKGFVNDKNVLESMQICREYGITPETIMVFGGPNETHSSLESAYTLTAEFQKKFDAIPRPHVFKDLIPGNKYWSGLVPTEKAKERKELLFRNPRYCQAMDFKALASSVCHPNPELRMLVNKYYRLITALCESEREQDGIIYPIAPEYSNKENHLHALWNTGRFDR